MNKGIHVYKIGGKWKILIIVLLSKSPLRFNKIKQVIACSGNSLSQNLQQLQDNGIVTQTDCDYIKYELTTRGYEIAEVVIELDTLLSKLP